MKPFYVSSFVALLNILQWTYGVLLLTKDRKYLSFQKIRTNPIVLSFLGGLILFFLPISLPEILNGPIRTLASMNGPLAMIVLGTYPCADSSEITLDGSYRIQMFFCKTDCNPAAYDLAFTDIPVRIPYIKTNCFDRRIRSGRF